ncbi:hypothetical protein [Jiella pacifica]|uniref:Uncharacterized protein n=1 Tax=Jiella pacifica TaxID=2696469 RepID=A0A6N9T6N3_9HYPH|nr:hypothetical protein [Jiella pacifica]NDW05875.1 hypothetical protein [Jiella pacifica]
MNKTQAFESYGAVFKSVRWSWSAKAPDDSLVVLTFWKDRLVFDKASKSFSYEGMGCDSEDVANRAGNVERRENIRIALEKLDGVVRVVVTVAEDVAARPRKIASVYPLPNVQMKITEFNDKTGEFRARSVPGASSSP